MFTTVHAVNIDCPAERAYSLIKEVEKWPDYFSPNLSAISLSMEGDKELIRVSALSNGSPKLWESERWHYDDQMKIVFKQSNPDPILSVMEGSWIVEDLNHKTRVRFEHRFEPSHEKFYNQVNSAVETNSKEELAGLKAVLENGQSFNKRYRRSVKEYRFNCDPDSLYRFVRDAINWTELIPHVNSCEISPIEGPFQTFTLETVSPESDTTLTESIRVYDDELKVIHFKQTTLPDGLALHNGIWSFETEQSGKTLAKVTHSLALTEEWGESDKLVSTLDWLEEHMHSNSLVTLKSYLQ